MYSVSYNATNLMLTLGPPFKYLSKEQKPSRDRFKITNTLKSRPLKKKDHTTINT